MRDMKKEIKELLDRLIFYEWCEGITPEGAKKIIESERLEADEFACAVMKASGSDPTSEINIRRWIRNEFVLQFGCREISQNDVFWGIR